jgi:4-amino-4-deoxy-L-arabinose transferase-like glycosyltransferase
VELIRLPTAIVGVLTVLVMFGLARQVFKSDAIAWMTAAMLALTPAYFMYSRVGVDVIYPLTFAMLWLWALSRYFEEGRSRWLAAAGLAMSVGMYSYLVATVLMPLFFILTAISILGRASLRAYATLAIAFLVPLIPLGVWELTHPERHTALVSTYRLYDGTRFNVLQGAKEALSYFSIGVRVDSYWNCLNPGFLFFSGDSSLMNSTRLAGCFLTAMGVLIALGAIYIWTHRRSPFTLVLIAALLLSPLPSVLTAEVATRRVILLVPFGVLIAGYGVEALVRQRQLAARALCALLLLSMPLQFARFYRDYMGEYRVRSAPWFGGNILGGMNQLVDLQSNDRPPVYLSDGVQYVDTYWQFCLASRGRERLIAETRYISGQAGDPAALPPGTLILVSAGEPLEAAVQRGGWRPLRSIEEPNSTRSFGIYERP